MLWVVCDKLCIVTSVGLSLKQLSWSFFRVKCEVSTHRCYSMADLAWYKRQLASILFATPPTSTYEEVEIRLNTLRPTQNGRHFADEFSTCISLNENFWIKEKSLTYVLYGLIDNMAALVQIMAWRRTGEKALSEAVMVCLLTHMCVSLPQWGKKKYLISDIHLLIYYDTRTL